MSERKGWVLIAARAVVFAIVGVALAIACSDDAPSQFDCTMAEEHRGRASHWSDLAEKFYEQGDDLRGREYAERAMNHIDLADRYDPKSECP